MFEQQDIEVKETVEARKLHIAEDKAWELLKDAGEIVIGRGKNVLTFIPSSDNKAEILSSCLGRSGNLRAPTLKIGNRFIVGYNEEIYKTYLGR